MRKAIGSPEQKLLAQLLRDARSAAGLTQRELAAKLGKPQAFVSRYEAGERRFDLIELDQVCQALETTVLQVVKAWEAQRRK